jgi:hydrazine synthase alpha subunit-like protein
VLPIAIGKERPVPTSPAAATADTPDGTALIGALDVRTSSLGDRAPKDGMYRIRVIEGFSAEEGIPDDFGLTESDGAILLGEAPVVWDGDHSFAAFVPEDRPMHLQSLDQFGMSMLNEDRWFSAARGEQRFCGGCHEERGGTTTANPGLTDAMGMGPSNFALAYGDRKLADADTKDYAQMVGKLIDPTDATFASADRVRGMPWDMSVQPVLDAAGCGSNGCHDGAQTAANPCASITTDMPAGQPAVEPVTWCFDLRGEKIDFTYGMMTGNYTRSHISMLLMAGMSGEPHVHVDSLDAAHPYQSYMIPQAARDSILIKYLQPEQVYPTKDSTKLAFSTEMKVNGQPYETQHPNASTPGYIEGTHRPLTTEEKYLFILVADMGAQYYSLENAPGGSY